MPDKDTILAVLSSGIALAGLLLIFAGFLFTKAASFESRRGDKFRLFAKFTLVPVLAALTLSWLSIDALNGNQWVLHYLLTCLKIVLGMTGAFAIIGVFASA